MKVKDNELRSMAKPSMTLVFAIPLIAILIMIVWLGINHYRSQFDFMSFPRVCYVVPRNFLGAVRISVVANGTQPVLHPDGVFEIAIPPTGIVDLDSSRNVFSSSVRESAVYSDGSQLPMGIEMSEHDMTTIAFWGLYTEGKGNNWFFVGNRNEMIKAWGIFELRPGEQVEQDSPPAEAIARPTERGK